MSATDRQIRVFVSSTFRDMQRERELLVKRVFPELRRICAERFVTFTEVDLRWGITEEQASEGQVLPICLEEINLSRPFFIGLLGERYGWIPETVLPAVLAREPWLHEHVGQRISVTELEILHGVLNNPQMAGHAYFYFRDPAYVLSGAVSAAERVAFAAEDTESAQKLNRLKEAIRRSQLPRVENYPDPDSLAAQVHAQFLALIDQLYPADRTLEPLDHEAIGHDSYAARKLLAFVPRPVHTAVLETFAAAGSTPQGLVVTGESGGGKSSLLADWIRERRAAHRGDFVFAHYFGSTVDSASVSRFLARLLGELRRRFDLADEVPADPRCLREALPHWLAQTIGRVSIVLVLDALNQIEGDEADRRLVWLPRYFPAHVRVLASTLPGPALEALRERDWVEHPLPPIDVAERRQMIASFFRHYRKEPGTALRDQLAGAPGSANPLFLRTVLEELRQFGSFEQLPVKVSEYLAATTSEELFRLVLRRWQDDFDAGCNLVRRALTQLWAARQGLSETEWRELLGASHAPLLRQVWSPLFLAIEPHLVLHSGLHAFGHDFLRRAVGAEWLPVEVDRNAAHALLADYFERQPLGARKAVELPWQLREGGLRDRLRASLLDVSLFRLIFARDQNELMSYWVWLGEQRTMGQAYLKSFEQWATGNAEAVEVARTANDLSLLLHDAALFAEGELLCRRALAINESRLGSNHPNVAVGLNNLAGSLRVTNRLAEAEPLYRRAVAISESSLGSDHSVVAMNLSNLAGLLNDINRLAEAEPLYRRALEIKENALGTDHPKVAAALNNLARLLQATSRYAEAEPLFRRALAISENSLGADHPSVAIRLNNLAELLRATGHLAEAEPLFRRALAISEKSLGSEHLTLAIRLNNLASLFLATNRPAEAETLFRRALAISEKNLGADHPTVATGLNNLAALLKATSRLAEAEPLYRRALAINEKSLGADHPTVAGSLNNLAGALHAGNRLAEAEQLYRRTVVVLLEFTRATGHLHPNLRAALANYAGLLSALGRGRQDVLSELDAIAQPYGIRLDSRGLPL